VTPEVSSGCGILKVWQRVCRDEAAALGGGALVRGRESVVVCPGFRWIELAYEFTGLISRKSQEFRANWYGVPVFLQVGPGSRLREANCLMGVVRSVMVSSDYLKLYGC